MGLHPEQGGIYVYVPGARDDSLMQVRASLRNQQWISAEEAQMDGDSPVIR